VTVSALSPMITDAFPARRPGTWHRAIEGLLARMRGRSLEQRLVAGAEPAGDPLLARRAAQLAGSRVRSATAAGLERAIDDARAPRRAMLSSAVPVCRAEVLLAAPSLLALVRRLEDGQPIWPVGIARIRATLMDSRSPLYVGATPGVLRVWAQVTLDELNDGLG
jgi:hypothetical protein